MDRISELPDIAFEMILERLPLLDAVRTSSVSKKWQFKWAMLSKLSLDQVFFDTLYKQSQKPPDITYPSLVKTILLQHIGPLDKLVIYIPDLHCPRIDEINLPMRVALTNGIRDLTVIKDGYHEHALPSFLLSCAQQLTNLKLVKCLFDLPSELKGFPNLESLYLTSICTNLGRLSAFISNCPKLRRIELSELDVCDDEDICINAPSLEDFSVRGRFRSILLPKSRNLVSFGICLDYVDLKKATPGTDCMLQLFSNLCGIKYLRLQGYIFELLGAVCLTRKLATELDNLKTIEAVYVLLGNKREFQCLLLLFRSSPNLQHIRIIAFDEKDTSEEPCFLSATEDYVDCCFRCLRTVEITEFRGTKAQLKMIEILLGHSPVLQVMSIQVESWLDKDAAIELLKELNRFSRASPTAQILWHI